MQKRDPTQLEDYRDTTLNIVGDEKDWSYDDLIESLDLAY